MLTRLDGGSTIDHHLDHVLEYENHSGLDNAWKKIPGSDVRSISLGLLCIFLIPAQHKRAHDALRPFLRSRATQLAQEFAFLPTSPPHEEGGIFELRAYQLSPGTLLEWEATWFALHTAFRLWFSSRCTPHRRRGIEARRKLVRPVGAWYAQLGRLHQVYHLWQYQCVHLWLLLFRALMSSI